MILFHSSDLSKSCEVNAKLEANDSTNINYSSLISGINVSNIMRHAKFFSNLESRFTGYPGADLAAEYIFREFSALELSDIQVQKFDVIVPIDNESFLEVITNKGESLRIRIYPLIPNLVATSNTGPDGLSGRLIYVDAKEPDGLKGCFLNDSIVIMDYNSGYNWIYAAMLGAKAVIFVEPEPNAYPLWTSSKYVSRVPFKFPRFYISHEDGLKIISLLRNNNASAFVKCDQRFVSKEGKNIFGLIKGTDFPEEMIAITAHYDSWSIVPSLAPGAEDALGISVLLEIGRFFKEHPPKRSILLIAFSGFWQSFSGVRAFIEEYWFNQTNFRNFGSKIKVAFSLDFSTDSESLGVFPWGEFYHGHPERLTYYRWLDNLIFNEYLPKITSQVSQKKYVVDNGFSPFWEQLPLSLITFDAEAFTVAGGTGVAFRTSKSLRVRSCSPLDKFEYINFDNLIKQVEPAVAILYSLSVEPVTLSSLGLIEPSPTRRSQGGATNLGFGKILGKVVTYNINSGRYEPIPGALVAVIEAVEVLGGRSGVVLSNQPNSFFNLLLKTDEEGKFEVIGVRTSMQDMWTDVKYYIFPYVINSSNGNIEYAIDMGRYGTNGVPVQVVMSFGEVHTSTFAFKCGTIYVLGLLNYKSLSSTLRFNVLDASSLSEPLFYGIQTDPVFALWLTTFYVEPRKPAAFLGFVGNDIRAILLNEGKGYTVMDGEYLFLTLAPLAVAKDFIQVNAERFNLVQPFGIRSPGEVSEKYYSLALSYQREAEEYVKIDSAKSFVYAFSAWCFASESYAGLLSLVRDIINTTWVYLFFLLPFAFVFERLVVAARGIKRILVLVAIISVFTYLLYFLHPGFSFVSNAPMVIIGVSVIVLVTPLIIIFASRVIEQITLLRSKIRGAHFIIKGRFSAIIFALSVGVENMRKRKLRTSLTLITVTLIVFSMVALTSAYLFIETQPIITYHNIPMSYEGIMVRGVPYGELSLWLSDFLKLYSADKSFVSPRFWLYPYGYNDPSLPGAFEISFNGKKISIKAILGLTPEEFKFNKPLTLISGRHFIPEDKWVMILSNTTASRLGCDLNDKISLFGINFTLIGVIDDAVLDGTYDVDGQLFTPVNWLMAAGLTGETIEAPHLHAEEVALVPFTTALALDGMLRVPASGIYNIVLYFGSHEEAIQVAKDLALRFPNLYIFCGANRETIVYRTINLVSLYGTTTLIIPIFIGAMVILNTMLGGVYERRKEIAIFSSVGLSPMEVGGIFLAEAIVHAVIGGMIGFISGIAGMKTFYALNVFTKEFHLNYSSSFVLSSIGLAMFTTIISSIYPFIVSSKMVTPSLERKWKLPKPKGDEWLIVFPLKMEEREVNGCLSFMKEYFKGFMGRRVGEFEAENISYEEKDSAKILRVRVNLAPWEYGVSQDVEIITSASQEKGMWSWEMHIRRVAGTTIVWRRANKIFIDSIRKQLLLWRSLTPAQRSMYIEKASVILRG
jgi:hypothetical protein